MRAVLCSSEPFASLAQCWSATSSRACWAAELRGRGTSRVTGISAGERWRWSAAHGRSTKRGAEPAGGTVPFVAPEWARADAVSGPSGVVALAVTLWVLLARDSPCGRKGLLGATRIAEPCVPDGCDAISAAALRLSLRALAA